MRVLLPDLPAIVLLGQTIRIEISTEAVPPARYAKHSLRLEPDDRFTLVSDTVVEAAAQAWCPNDDTTGLTVRRNS